MPEKRVVLKNCGVIDPKDIESFISNGGFAGLKKAMDMTPSEVIQEIKDSNLRGRGGAGFPTGLKWDFASKAKGDEKYVICNADEGEVGTFKDRVILEEDPFSLIEAVAIASYAIGAKEAFIYLRAEYHYLLENLQNAIDQTKDKGFLDHVNIIIYEGAGAYVCGEETALIESIEGKRGDSRPRPPFPPSEGLWGKPTIVNNVETLMNIPRIMAEGKEWFNSIGTESSKGTKVLSVSGDVNKPGVYEMVMGSSLKELVEDLAGAENVKMVQVGGASGRIVPFENIDTPLTFETVLGAGGVLVFNNTRDVIEMVKKNAEFFEEESCGKCFPCREGTKRMLEILERLTEGTASRIDLEFLEDLSETMALTSLCGLGQAAPNSVVDTMEFYREEYESRVNDKVKV
ncbi:NADP oxidoreductase [Candidatus Poribacteria bacterium]|nr:NADP oxidoreductase [Candidatus Poribacteria bacterium]